MAIRHSFEIRNPRTHAFMGYMDNWEKEIYVPLVGQMVSFIQDYEALKHNDVGIAIEVYDVEQQKVDHFSILYHFERQGVNILEEDIYKVFSERCTNLEMLEFINFYKKLGDKNGNI